ncbi:MAG TPA: hypothetical protein VKZ67_15035 [Natronosporangium sp.]|nr:hypothetical protein [Natronosporangium sp.]
MSTHAAPARGLSPAEIEEIRAALTAGRKPKVVFTPQAGQIAGQVGQVVSLGDPSVSDEWLVVRFGRDELPFAPADLAIPPKGRSPRTAGASTSAVPEPRSASSASPSPDATGAAGGGKADGAATGPAKADSAKADSTKADSTGAKPARRTRSGKSGKPKPPPALTVTLAYEAGEWTVAASQGSRVLAKPYLVRPTEALQMVAMLDVPGVQEAVEQIVAAELAEAQQRAEVLRSELAEVEARLAELSGAAAQVAPEAAEAAGS